MIRRRFLIPWILFVYAVGTNAFVAQLNKSQAQTVRTQSVSSNPKHPIVQSCSCRQSSWSLALHEQSLFLAEQSLSLRNTDVWVFIAGIIPFAWATVEFWRRIAAGEPFGTSGDSVYIGKDNAPEESRGRRVLDKGAFLVAYILFGIAAAALFLTLYSVVTSPPPTDVPL